MAQRLAPFTRRAGKQSRRAAGTLGLRGALPLETGPVREQEVISRSKQALHGSAFVEGDRQQRDRGPWRLSLSQLTSVAARGMEEEGKCRRGAMEAAACRSRPDAARWALRRTPTAGMSSAASPWRRGSEV